MPIDNDIYNRIGDSWWEEDNPLNVLHGSMTPARFGYFHDVLTKRQGRELTGLRALDIGSGGGFLAEEFARLGCRVVGVDPSEVSIQAARRHAVDSGLDIDYRVGTGERLPVGDSEYDVAYCCDVLEHVSDVDQVIAEAARALKPGGTFFYDTINRTRTSKVLAIKVMQEWRATRIMDSALHVWDMFITPDELVTTMRRHGLHSGDVVGLAPQANKLVVLVDFARAQRGRISYGELSRRLRFGPAKRLDISYMGFATKPDTSGH